jgi:hypothetical protein
MSEETNDNIAAGATAVGGALMMVPGPTQVVGGALMAAGMAYTALSGKKKKKKIAAQQEARARELQRRARANADALMRKTKMKSQVSQIAFARGGVTGSSAVETQENIILQGQEQADKMIADAEYGASQMYLQAENTRAQARDEAKAGLVSATAQFGSSVGSYGKEKGKNGKTNWENWFPEK